MFEDELLRFSPAQKKSLVRGGLKVVELPGEGVLRARQIVREFARRQKIEVHGVLWVIDELDVHRISTGGTLHAALQVLARDPTVRLPQHEMAAYLKRYAGN